MRTNWPLRTIAECAANEPYSTQIGPFGEKLKAHNYTPTGAPVLRGMNVNREGRFHDDDFVFIEPEWAASEFDKFECAANDVILCHKGTLGKIGIIPKTSRFPKYIMGNSMMKVRCDRTKLEPLYLYYWLCSTDGQKYIFSRVSQVGVPQIQRPLSTLREAILPVPPLETQRAIARILGALDDKIELNRKMNSTLEAMARAFFESWFQEETEGGGLDEKTVSDLAADGILQVGDGYRAKNSEMASEGLPFARAGNIDNGFDFARADLLGSPGVSRAGDKISRPSDVVFTSKGTVGRFAFVDPAMQPFVYSPQLCFWRSMDHEALNPFVLRQWMASRWFLDQVDRVKGQTDMAEYVSLRDQRAMRFPVATPQAQAAIGSQLARLQHLVWKNERETQVLARIRDELLPRLLSGELPLDAAEQAGSELA